MTLQLPSILEVFSRSYTSLPGPGYRYRSVYHWVLDTGLPFDSQGLTPAEWKICQKYIHFTEPRECFSNCQRTVLEERFLQVSSIARGEIGLAHPFQYVEGYIITGRCPIPVHHAWLLLHGKVIDPTLPLHKPYKRKLFPDRALGRFPAQREYFGTVIPWRAVAKCIKTNLAWHTVLDDPAGGYPLLKED